jgi:signal transduction histidine kinase/CheY-like chemotaxis protein/HPt (histidine-containing phosphotransfer) domain-containing protein
MYLRRKDGSLFPVEMSATVTFSADGKSILHIDGTMRDISTLKAAEELIRQKQADLSEAQQMALLGNWTLELHDEDIAFLPEYYRSNGLESIHPMPFSQAFLDEVPADDKSNFKKALETALHDGQAEYEFKCIGQNSQVKHIKGMVRRSSSKTGARWSLFGISRDVTKEKEAEAELQRARERAEMLAKAKQQFLANMSHEIRTPINGIRGMAHLLAQTTLDLDQQTYVGAIQTSSDTLLGLINDVLDIAKIESGKITFEKSLFNLWNVIRAVGQIIQVKAVGKNLPVETIIHPDVPETVVGDSLRLSQVLTNIMDNAVKFTEKGSVKLEILLLGEQTDSWDLKFIVSDTGIGIPPGKINQIFGIFEQTDSSITRKYGGSGLGLAIVKRLIEDQGGKITVESTPGFGSTFAFTLSFGKPSEYKYTPSLNRLKNQPHDLSHLTILVADDNAINRLWVSKLLENWGCRIIEAENGIDALNKMQTFTIDMILMDLYMPEMDGYEASRRIRSEFPAPANQVPIIALTADVMDNQAQRSMDAGINIWLGKPFDPEELYQLIRQLTFQPVKEAPAQNVGKVSNARLQHLEAHFNLETLKAIAEDDEVFLNKLLDDFDTLCHETTASLKTAIESNDLEEIRKNIHRIKPNLDYVGAHDQFKLADDILKLFKIQNTGSSDQIIEKSKAFLEQLLCIQQILERASGASS